MKYLIKNYFYFQKNEKHWVTLSLPQPNIVKDMNRCKVSNDGEQK